MDSSTYEANAITIGWTYPVDTGCVAINEYKIQGTLDSTNSASWFDLTTGLTASPGRVQDDAALVAAGTITALVVPGQTVSLRVVAKNGICPLSVCDGAGSDHIDLIPAALPDAPAEITITYGILGTLTLDWPIPVSTGGGD